MQSDSISNLNHPGIHYRESEKPALLKRQVQVDPPFGALSLNLGSRKLGCLGFRDYRPKEKFV